MLKQSLWILRHHRTSRVCCRLGALRDRGALERLIPLVYNELHRIARGHMRRERAGATLQTSALVNEAYVRLVGVADAGWRNRGHFFAISAQMMRRILVDAARARGSAKRGGAASGCRSTKQ